MDAALDEASLVAVFSHLSLGELPQVSLVCKKWASVVCDSNALWKSVYERRFGKAATDVPDRVWKDVCRASLKSETVSREEGRAKYVTELAGQHYSALLTRDGKLYLTGSAGDLYKGKTDGCYPERIGGCLHDEGVSFVSVGRVHFVGISIKGKVYTWGSGRYGRLGHGDANDIEIPKEVEFFKGKVLTWASAGDSETAFVDSDGFLYTCGSGENGRLGHGDFLNHMAPKRVEALVAKNEKVTCVSCGDNHIACVTKSGRLYSWGVSFNGQLGVPDGKDVLVPQIVASLQSRYLVQVSCGAEFTAVLDSDGRVYTMGVGGHTRSSKPFYEPSALSCLDNVRIVAISAGTFHLCALDDGGALYQVHLFIGQSRDGETRLEYKLRLEIEFMREDDMKLAGKRVTKKKRKKAKKSVGTKKKKRKDSVAVDENNLSGGESGKRRRKRRASSASDPSIASPREEDPLTSNASTPAAQSEEEDERPKKKKRKEKSYDGRANLIAGLSAGANHTIAICNSGTVHIWGRGQSGQLGHGETNDERLPKRVEDLVHENLSGVVVTEESIKKEHEWLMQKKAERDEKRARQAEKKKGADEDSDSDSSSDEEENPSARRATIVEVVSMTIVEEEEGDDDEKDEPVKSPEEHAEPDRPDSEDVAASTAEEKEAPAAPSEEKVEPSEGTTQRVDDGNDPPALESTGDDVEQ